MKEDKLTKAIQHEAEGRVAFEDSRYIEAADSFGKAATFCLQGLLTLYCTHTRALISAEKFHEAKKVSEFATRIDPTNSSVWYWYGMALLKLDQKKEAKCAFEKGLSHLRSLNEKACYMDWVQKCQEQLESVDATAPDSNSPSNGSASTDAATNPPSSAPAPAPSQTSVQVPKDKIRMQWYQSGTYIYIDIYAKNIIKEESSVVIEDSRVKFQLGLPVSDEYVFERELFGKIVIEESTWNISSFKFEARLKKASVGGMWKALDKETKIVSAVLQAGRETPRSKDSRAVRYRKLKEYAERELKDENGLSAFQKLYKYADDDMRRAMVKSYCESGGKVLSTNWEDVRRRKVEYNPSN